MHQIALSQATPLAKDVGPAPQPNNVEACHSPGSNIYTVQIPETPSGLSIKSQHVTYPVKLGHLRSYLGVDRDAELDAVLTEYERAQHVAISNEIRDIVYLANRQAVRGPRVRTAPYDLMEGLSLADKAIFCSLYRAHGAALGLEGKHASPNFATYVNTHHCFVEGHPFPAKTRAEQAFHLVAIRGENYALVEERDSVSPTRPYPYPLQIEDFKTSVKTIVAKHGLYNAVPAVAAAAAAKA